MFSAHRTSSKLACSVNGFSLSNRWEDASSRSWAAITRRRSVDGSTRATTRNVPEGRAARAAQWWVTICPQPTMIKGRGCAGMFMLSARRAAVGSDSVGTSSVVVDRAYAQSVLLSLVEEGETRACCWNSAVGHGTQQKLQKWPREPSGYEPVKLSGYELVERRNSHLCSVSVCEGRFYFCPLVQRDTLPTLAWVLPTRGTAAPVPVQDDSAAAAGPDNTLVPAVSTVHALSGAGFSLCRVGRRP